MGTLQNFIEDINKLSEKEIETNYTKIYMYELENLHIDVDPQTCEYLYVSNDLDSIAFRSDDTFGICVYFLAEPTQEHFNFFGNYAFFDNEVKSVDKLLKSINFEDLETLRKRESL